MASSLEWLSKLSPRLIYDWINAKSVLAKVSSFLLSRLTPTHNPVISQKRDRNGDIAWRIYDPHANQAYWFTTEAEVRIWLDSYFSWIAILTKGQT